ncbi:hypothetical protein TA3x_003209 [Tundrisphaera sp. TA3]|uniref:hypothetical protein n=1 Tax=Tundrisphaera sp. TA3 TaxID=3435775 RepID=UPI003EBB6A11
MTCDDADRLWHEILDGRGDPRPGPDALLAVHASSCDRCRAASARYRVLSTALLAPRPVPDPSPDLERRILDAWEAGRPRPARPLPRRILWLAPALAASILALAWIAARPGPPPPRPSRPEIGIHLASALTDATSATIELARGVSAPAARIGMDVLDLDDEAADPSDDDPGDAVRAQDAIDLLRLMGDRIDEGARPLSGSALHAFEFLLPAQ